MGDNVVRLNEYRDRPSRRPARRGRGRSGAPPAGAPEPGIVLVEPLPPDRAVLTIPRRLWPELSTWLAARGVRVTGVL